MRIANSLMLVMGGYFAAVACGGSSQVSVAGDPQEDGGEGGELNGKGGSSGKGGASGKGGKGGTSSKGGGGGTAGEAGSEQGGSVSVSGSGGDAGTPGTGGSGGDPGTGGVAGEGGFGGDLGAGTGGDAGASTIGSLRVIVTAPARSTGVSVDIDGPDGFDRTITSTRTFSDISVGEYTVTSTLAFVPGPVVSTFYEPLITGSPATVVGGVQSNVLVTYPLPFGGTGRLWVADYGRGTISAFDAARLEAGSTEVGDLRLTIPGSGRLSQAIAFDAEGNAWIGDCASTADVVKVAPADLSGSGDVTATPEVVLGPPAETWANCVVSIDFDADGNMYVAHFNGHVLRYTPDQLDVSASPSAPAAVLASANFGQIQDTLIDADGNLWVSAYAGNAVSKLSPSQLQTSNETIVPAAAWSISEPEGLALGPDGNLWVATYSNHVRAYDPSATSVPTPARDITLPAGFGPVGIAFDESGNLWATSYNLGKVARFNAADLTSDGAKVAAFELTNPDFLSGWSLAFNPAP